MENVNVENTQEKDNVIVNSEQVKEPSYNDYRRELSKELGVNLFEKDGLKDLKNILAEHKEFKDSQKSEYQKLQDEVESYKNKNKDLQSQLLEKDSRIVATKLNIKDESYNDVLTLAKPLVNDKIDLNQAMSQIVEKYPSFTNKKADVTVEVGTQTQETNSTTGKDPVLEAFYKRRGK